MEGKIFNYIPIMEIKDIIEKWLTVIALVAASSDICSRISINLLIKFIDMSLRQSNRRQISMKLTSRLFIIARNQIGLKGVPWGTPL